MTRHRPHRGGVARVLTLVALGAVVVALALPLLNLQIERSRRARCLGNLHSIWAAMQLYATDWNGWFPVVSRIGGDGSRGVAENGFNRHAALLLNSRYASDAGIFHCPSDREDGDPSRPISDNGATGHARARPATAPTNSSGWVAAGNLEWFNISYVYVAGLTIRDRGDFLLLADEHWDSEGDCPADCRHDVDEFDNHGKAGRNVLFLDGRAEWLAGPRIDAAYAPILDGKAQYRTRTVD